MRHLPATLLAGLLTLLGLAAPAPAHGTFWVPPEPPPPADVPEEKPSAPIPASGGSSTQPGGSPGTGGIGVPSPSGPTNAPSTPGTLGQAQLTNWSYWWYFNREPLLDLRRRFDEQALLSGGGAQAVTNRPSDAALENTVLPALLELAGPQRQDNVRLTAGIALGRIGHPLTDELREALAEHVRSKDPTLQQGAMLSVGLLGDFWALETLATGLANEREARAVFGGKLGSRERAFAAYALGVMADRAPHDAQRAMVLAPLWAVLEDTRDDREVRVAAANALGLVRLTWEDGRALPGADPELELPTDRPALIEALWERYLDEDDVFVRGHLPIALARLADGGPDDVRDALIERFIERLEARREPRVQDLHGLVIGLGIVGNAWGRASDTRLRRTLYRIAIEEGDAHARHLALMSLAAVVGRTGPSLPPAPVQAELEAFLTEGLASAKAMDAPWFAMSAGALGARLKRPVAGRSPGQLGTELIAALREIVDDAGSPNTLSAAVLALGLAEDLDSGETVERLFDRSRNRDVQAYAALSLGLLGRGDAAPKLEEFLHEARYMPVALEHASIGLALLSRPRAVAALQARLANAHSGIIAAPLAATLGHVGDASVVLPLAKLADDRSQTLATRENLALALGLISSRRGPSGLTWRASLATDVNYTAWVPSLFDQAGTGILNIN